MGALSVDRRDAPATQKLCLVLGDALQSLVIMVYKYFSTLMPTTGHSGAKTALGHLRESLVTMYGHLMSHGNNTTAISGYLTVIAELTTSSGFQALCGPDWDFVRPLPSVKYPAIHVCNFLLVYL